MFRLLFWVEKINGFSKGPGNDLKSLECPRNLLLLMNSKIWSEALVWTMQTACDDPSCDYFLFFRPAELSSSNTSKIAPEILRHAYNTQQMPVKCDLSRPHWSKCRSSVHGGGSEAVKGEGVGPSHTWVYTLTHHLLAMRLQASDPPSPSPHVW